MSELKLIGVDWKPIQRRFHARLYLTNETIHCGSFKDKRKAAIARDIECIKRGLLDKVQILKPKR